MCAMRQSNIAKKVLVLLSNVSVTHRRHLRGILEYVHGTIFPPWEVQLGLSDIDAGYKQNLSPGNYDGIIAAVHRAEDRRRILASGIPAVLYEPPLCMPPRRARPHNVVTFFNDHEVEGNTAAEYFLERGYTSFAYVGTAVRTAWSEARMIGFRARLSKDGFSPAIYTPPPYTARKDFALEAKHLVAWLRKLPSRTALFAAHDERAREVVLAARRAGLAIPDDMAVMGVDDDELLCSTASQPISSIAVDARETGILFAKALESLMDGHAHDPIIRTCHTRIVARRSTDAFAFNDPLLSRALSYAAANLAVHPRMEDLATAARCSIRTLQLRAKAILGRTIKDEISALQVHEASRRLSIRDGKPDEIARATGFYNASHMYRRIQNCNGKVSKFEI